MAERENLLILRPLGPQGPKIGVKIEEVGDYIALDVALGQLNPGERNTVKGQRRAISIAGLKEVESLRGPEEDEDNPR